MNGACHQGDGFDMDKDFLAIFNAIKADGANADYTKRGIDPLYSVGAGARIVVIGQAPGAVAEETRIPWNDKSGERLRDWLGVSRETFYDPERVALLPMDFYFPGHGRSGDLPPRKGFAEQWHPALYRAYYRHAQGIGGSVRSFLFDRFFKKTGTPKRPS